MILNELRIGNFTSSEIHQLTKRDRSGKGFGAPALTYIKQTNRERRAGRSVDKEVFARALSWGKLCEPFVAEVLPFEYDLCSDVTIQHPQYDFWAGSPDVIAPHTVGDIKCPDSVDSYITFADCTTIDEVRSEHRDGEKYYWQIVSNAIITEQPFGELIVFCPYKSQLNDIRRLAMEKDRCDWVLRAEDEELPYMIDGGYYKNLHIIRFEIPQADKYILTESVVGAGRLLVSRK